MYAWCERRGGEVIVEDLKEHSVMTAAVGLALFKEELRWVDEFVAAALLHDVGKANKRSLRQCEEVRLGKRERASFRCHEVLSAQAALELMGFMNADYAAVMYAVLRHHHAMRKVRDCLKEDLELGDVGALKDLIPHLSNLKGLKPSSELFDIASKVRDLGKAFILTGFLSLADSVAATLFRRPDSSGKPS
ncbi:MAG: CRISPR-associated endonuclease Cas3'', partial [Crenarchaeota archaeon]|nr:CRISPR-associated endonuclease Cas3'' [Thermoproteota archaeon]